MAKDKNSTQQETPEETLTEETSTEEASAETEETVESENDYLEELLNLDEDGEDFLSTLDNTSTEEPTKETTSSTPEEGKEDGEEAETVEASTEDGEGSETTPKPEEPSQPQADPEPQKPESSETASPSPEDLNTQFQEFFKSSAEQLATEVYALDKETAEKLDTSPSEVIPQLAGQLHMQVLTAALTQAANLIPGMLSQQLERNSASEQAESAFFSKFPKLKEHSTEVTRIAKAYRQANPNMDPEVMIDEIGTIASVRLKVPLPGDQPPPPESVQVVPPTPTTARGSGASPPPPTQTTWLDELISEED